MALAVHLFLREDGGGYQVTQVAPGEWRATWQRAHPRELLVLGTFFTDRESEARAALTTLLWEALRAPHGSLARLQ